MANLGIKLSVKTFNALLDGDLKLGDGVSLRCSHCETVVSTAQEFCDHIVLWHKMADEAYVRATLVKLESSDAK